MLLPFRLFGGGRLGSGRQYMSWIHWRDWAGVVGWFLDRAATSGPVNICTAAPVTNREFANTLGRVLRRPSWLPAPAFAIRTVVGEMADALLFTSIRMVPRRLLDLGYRYEFPALEGALQELLR
jgi:NAD dependent epimerase/dehydratase family enzyme